MMSHNARRVCGSSPALGSSRNNTCGSWAIARAICTRCASPPESCATIRLLALRQFEQLDQFVRLGRGLGAAHPEVAAMKVHVLENGALPIKRIELRHHAHVAARLGRMRHHINARDRDFARGGQRARGADADGRCLARAIGAEQAKQFPTRAPPDRCPSPLRPAFSGVNLLQPADIGQSCPSP